MKRMGSSWKVAARILFAVSLIVPLLAACTQGDKGSREEKRVLRIAYMSGDSRYDDYMRTQYTDLFEFTHKNIEIELIPAVDWSKRQYDVPKEGEPYKEPNYIEEMEKLIESDNPPDLVLVQTMEQLEVLIADNMLQPLESFIQADEFDIEGIVPAVLNGIRSVGNNELYALAPTFSSSALIYNRAIFEERGVEPPTDGMTWEEVFDLARRVAYGEGSERKYGFSFGTYFYDDLFWGLDMYVAPLGLRVMDETAENMLVDSDHWERVLQQLINLKTEKIMPEPPDMSGGDIMPRPYNPFEMDAFLSGRLAMSVIQYSQLNEIISANMNAANIEGFTPIQWDVVTLPTHAEAPGVGGFVYMDPLTGISAKAANPEDAWEFLKFINSEDWAELKSRSLSMMVSRKDYIKPRDGLDFNISAFYQLTPVMSSMNSFDPQLDPMIRQNLWQVTNLGQQKLNEMINGDVTVREGLKQWATEGAALLQQIRENPGGGVIAF
jgi:multiple sugar transport system substrate-binding protein